MPKPTAPEKRPLLGASTSHHDEAGPSHPRGQDGEVRRGGNVVDVDSGSVVDSPLMMPHYGSENIGYLTGKAGHKGSLGQRLSCR